MHLLDNIYTGGDKEKSGKNRENTSFYVRGEEEIPGNLVQYCSQKHIVEWKMKDNARLAEFAEYQSACVEKDKCRKEGDNQAPFLRLTHCKREGYRGDKGKEKELQPNIRSVVGSAYTVKELEVEVGKTEKLYI